MAAEPPSVGNEWKTLGLLVMLLVVWKHRKAKVLKSENCCAQLIFASSDLERYPE